MSTIRDGHQFRIMIGMSLIVHILLVGGWVLWYSFQSQATPEPRQLTALIVDLYDIRELAEPLRPETEPVDLPPPQELVTQEIVAVESIPTPLPTPTTTPTPTSTVTPVPTPTPQPQLLVTPTPRPRPMPTATPVPRPVATPTPVPTPTLTPTPEEAVAALDVPRRQGVMSSTPDPNTVQRVVEREGNVIGNPDNSRQQTVTFSNRLSRETPLMFETERAFPYPEYLLHIKEKIEGLWFPEGSGTVSVYMIIERNGKISNSGVDKGEGYEVNKLRESVMRAMSLIQRFEPLPAGYGGSTLHIRITVRR